MEYLPSPPSLLGRLQAPDAAAMLDFADSHAGSKAAAARGRAAIAALRGRYSHAPQNWEQWCAEHLAQQALPGAPPGRSTLRWGVVGAVAVGGLAIVAGILLQSQT